MLFNSFHFLFFFVVFLPLYFFTRGRLRKIITLLASYYFYMCWSRKYITLIWAITIVDFVTGILIERARAINLRRLYLFVSLGSNILLLIVFKYFNFMSLSISRALHHGGFAIKDPPLLLSVILPIGLSFHTFQAMSYTIEVYKGRSPAERSFLHYALYVAFFPQMVAGPIERPRQLLPQFHIEHRFSWLDVAYGARQTLWGLFKKISPWFVSVVFSLDCTCTSSITGKSGFGEVSKGACLFSGRHDLRFSLLRLDFFRASSLRDALFVSRQIFSFGHFDTHLFLAGGIQQADLPIFLFLVLTMFVVEWLIEHPEHRPILWSKRSVRYALYYACIFAVIFYGTFGHVDLFILSSS